MRLFLIRHGNCLGGNSDPALSKAGIQQAKLLAKRLHGLPITRAYVSDLARTCQTFEEYHRLAPGVKFEKTKDLREIYRVLVGGSPKEGTSRTRESDGKKRIESFIKQINSMNANECVALFTHGNVIRYILAKFLESDPKKMGPHLCISSSSISLIDIDNERANVRFVNNSGHLTDGSFGESCFLDETVDDCVA